MGNKEGTWRTRPHIHLLSTYTHSTLMKHHWTLLYTGGHLAIELCILQNGIERSFANLGTTYLKWQLSRYISHGHGSRQKIP